MIERFAAITLALLLLCSCGENKNKKWDHLKKDKEYSYVNLNDSDGLLKDLYQSDEFDALGNVIWTAAKIDFPEIPVCYDNKYHTKADTLMYFVDSQNDSCAVLILANYNIQLVKGKQLQVGSHFDPVSLGVALFKKEKYHWQLYKIKKHVTELGYFGTYRTGGEDAGTISLIKIGSNWTCLSFKQGVGGSTGEFWGYEKLFSIECELPEYPDLSYDHSDELKIKSYQTLTEILSYNYHHNYYYPDLDNQNSIDISMRTISGTGPINNIELDIEETNYHLETNKINSRKKLKRKFIFSPYSHVYVEQNTIGN